MYISASAADDDGGLWRIMGAYVTAIAYRRAIAPIVETCKGSTMFMRLAGSARHSFSRPCQMMEAETDSAVGFRIFFFYFPFYFHVT